MLITEQLVFIALFFSSIGFFMYIYIAYPFWSHMPIMHTPYSWAQTLFNTVETPIEKIPYRNKYVNTLKYQTCLAQDVSATIKDYFIDTLHCCYLPSDSILCTIDTAKFDAIFLGHQSFITVGQNGCISSLPLKCGIQNKPLYTISYLASPNKDITRNLLSTHVFNCRRKSPDCPYFLYKSYEECAGAVAYLTFNTHLYFVGKQPENINPIPVQQIGKNNWAYIYSVLDIINAKHTFTTWLSPASLKMRSDAGLLWVFAVLEPLTGAVLLAYFLDDALTLYENLDYGKLGLNLVGSYKDKNVSNKDFYDGLLKCIQIVQKQNLDYVMLTIDDVGHNASLLKKTPLKTTKGNYYLINQYFSKPIDKESAFIYGF